MGKRLNITFSTKFIFLYPAEFTEMKYFMPINEKEAVAAAIKIQAVWRGTYVRLLMKARTPGIIFQSLIK